jgi:hypothetical protein
MVTVFLQICKPSSFVEEFMQEMYIYCFTFMEREKLGRHFTAEGILLSNVIGFPDLEGLSY